MPYESEAQKKFFRGCAHGMKPKGGRKCPPKKVIKEFENEHVKRLREHGLHK